VNQVALYSRTIGSRMWRAVSSAPLTARLTGKKARPYLYGLALLMLLMVSPLGHTLIAYASTATPVPTETIAPLVIPINQIFTQANNWINTLSPVVSLSIGVMIALAVFGFLASAIKSAFG
jgi:hypothetical protein